MVEVAAGLGLVLSLLGLLTFFVLHPLALWVLFRLIPPTDRARADSLPGITLLVVVRNAGELIRDKLENALSLDYPSGKFDVVVYSDGSTDDTEQIARSYEGRQVRVLGSVEHHGKIPAMNTAIAQCSGEIVAFSDADAMIDRDALTRLAGHFAAPDVGGVCGRRIIGRDEAGLKEAQRRYIDLDSKIKEMENRIGGITSNDGKLYAIRRELYRPIPVAVTDDLYVALSVIAQGYRFAYEPEARAHVRVPSRDASHELQRRRRIVSQSLNGIFKLRKLLNPLESGWIAVELFLNKVLRRLIPFLLLMLLPSSLVLSFSRPWIVPLLAAQLAFYWLGLSSPLLGGSASRHLLGRAARVAYFFLVGQYGMMLGVLDFLTGRSVAKWDPVKTDTSHRAAHDPASRDR